MTGQMRDVPWQETAFDRGVRLLHTGDGRPVVIFPGLDGGGESCLHLVLPVLLPADGPPRGTVWFIDTREVNRAPLVLQRQLWRCLSAGAVVGVAGLGLASSAPPRSVGGVVEVGPWGADEGVEQAPEFGHGQRDELAVSGCGPPYFAVARVADR